jgi:hypothetical protein
MGAFNTGWDTVNLHRPILKLTYDTSLINVSFNFNMRPYIWPSECDALALIAAGKGAKKLVRNAKSTELGTKMPAPMGDGMPALAQRLGELVAGPSLLVSIFSKLNFELFVFLYRC